VIAIQSDPGVYYGGIKLLDLVGRKALNNTPKNKRRKT